MHSSDKNSLALSLSLSLLATNSHRTMGFSRARTLGLISRAQRERGARTLERHLYRGRTYTLSLCSTSTCRRLRRSPRARKQTPTERNEAILGVVLQARAALPKKKSSLSLSNVFYFSSFFFLVDVCLPNDICIDLLLNSNKLANCNHQ